MSISLVFDEIIMNIIRNKKLAFHNYENDCLFTQTKKTSFICTGGHFKTFTGKRNLRVSRSSMCTFPFLKTDMKHYLTHILKNETSSGEMNEKVDRWLDYFEKFHKKCIIICENRSQ